MVLKLGRFGQKIRNTWKVLKCGAAEVHAVYIFRVVTYPEVEQICSSKMLESHAKGVEEYPT
jgi:hypothetical protein